MKMSAEAVYKKQNNAIHKGMVRIGCPYSLYKKEVWLERFEAIAGKPVTGLSGLTLWQRSELIEDLRESGADIGRVFVSAEIAGWKKGDPDQVPARPMNVPGNKIRMVAKINAMLASMGLAWAYADGITGQMFDGCEYTEWLRPGQLHKVVQAMIFHQNRMKGRL
jgi:hypothetical protein